MSLLPFRRVRWAALGAIAAALVMGGIAYASIPGPDGVIHGCFGNNGALRVIDSAASCKSNETSLSWNQTGPTGSRGPTGARGPTGPTASLHAFSFATIDCSVSVCHAGTTVLTATATCPSGKTLLGGGGEASNESTLFLDPNFILESSVPGPGAGSWQVSAIFATTQTSDVWIVKAYAICTA
jgi:hypothetical protein